MNFHHHNNFSLPYFLPPIPAQQINSSWPSYCHQMTNWTPHLPSYSTCKYNSDSPTPPWVYHPTRYTPNGTNLSPGTCLHWHTGSTLPPCPCSYRRYRNISRGLSSHCCFLRKIIWAPSFIRPIWRLWWFINTHCLWAWSVTSWRNWKTPSRLGTRFVQGWWPWSRRYRRGSESLCCFLGSTRSSDGKMLPSLLPSKSTSKNRSSSSIVARDCLIFSNSYFSAGVALICLSTYSCWLWGTWSPNLRSAMVSYLLCRSMIMVMLFLSKSPIFLQIWFI